MPSGRRYKLIGQTSGGGGGASQLTDLSDVSTAAITNRFALMANGSAYVGRALVEADISDLGAYLTSVAVTDLDTGTDGELITWDASGNPTTVAVGTSGHVLTSNGAGAAPTFQAAAGGGSASEILYKTADESRNSTTTPADDTHLAGFSLTAGEWYAIEGHLGVTTVSAADMKFSYGFSQTPQAGWAGSGGSRSDLGACGGAVSTPAGTWGPNGNTNNVVILTGAFQANATTGGTVALQWAQRASNANNMTLQAGSWMKVTQLS